MTTAFIRPDVLLWARLRAQIEPDILAKKANIKPEKLRLWEHGEEKPTFKQAQNLARILHIPFGYLFLQSPPQETFPLPDLRTIGDHPTGEYSPNLKDLVADILRKQDWYRDYLINQGAEPISFIGRFKLNAGIADVAADMSETLQLTPADRDKVTNWEGFLRLLIDKGEDAGIWVMRSGIVASDTHRTLSVEEFRGFAICDDIVPAVFINGTDAKAAQIFTLVHEFAHLWFGESGISNLSLDQPVTAAYRDAEKKCNAVAAEVLVPEASLRENWKTNESVEQNLSRLSGYYRVSTVVIARKAFDTNLIDWQTYAEYYKQQAAKWREEKETPGFGGNFHLNLPLKNGRHFLFAVVQSALQNDLLLRDAGRLLNISPSKIIDLPEKIGMK